MPQTIIGQRYGRLTIAAELPRRQQPSGKTCRMVLARCDCGTERHFQFYNLKSGNSYSCGCYDAERLRERNAEFAKPQAWTIEGDVAFIFIRETKVLIDAEDVPLASKFKWHLDREARRHFGEFAFLNFPCTAGG